MSDVLPAARPCVTLPAQNHPEQRPNEVFIGDVSSAVREDFESIDYQTKRQGRNSYLEDGSINPGYFPVFVWQMEFDQVHNEVKVGQ